MQKKQVLIKYGGNAMLSAALQEEISFKIKELTDNGIQVILVHGGGPFINSALESAGITSEFINGHRFTSREALLKIETTLKGEVNSALVSSLNKVGLKAVGLSGKDGKMAIAEKRFHASEGDATIDLGLVGNIKQFDNTLVTILLTTGFTPVIASIASDKRGETYNINADMFAGQLAASLKVEEYIVLTDVDGLYLKYPDPDSIIQDVQLESVASYYGTIVQGGMIPKIESCEIALRGGVTKAAILNGTKPEQMEEYCLGGKAIGTTLRH